MTAALTRTRIRSAAAGLAIAGALFVLYPALRPFSDETTLEGAAAFASPNWLVAHVLAMIGFILTALGTGGLWIALGATRAERIAFGAVVTTAVGVGLTLPFYGGEAFGLHAIGTAALREQSAAILAISDDVRGGVGLVLFLVGLAILGLGAVASAIAIWRSGVLHKWSGVPFAVGFALFIPQFFLAQPLRVTHGALVALGCILIANELWRATRARDPKTVGVIDERT
jgi:hypothetical protein